jgi:hypothetical protein
MMHRLSALSAAASALLLLAACGGGNETAVVVPSDPTDSTRVAAATQTASTHPDCAPSKLGAYYWEIGDANGARAGGPVGSGGPAATTEFSIASASKWVYSAYVLQKVGARTQDAPYLNFTSGYTEFVIPLCQVSDTVSSCQDGKDNQVAADVGKFQYGSGHMQQHAAAVMGLGAMGITELSTEVGNTIANTNLFYTQPQLAGGLVGSAASYGAFLRRILRGELAIGAALGTQKVCTNPRTCSTALGAPIPDGESWNYSLGHWVEDDPAVGDHAFSSAGALGFYPWIDATKTLYGVLSRRSDDFEANAGYNSAVCGRLIRQAWVTGVAVTSGPPTPAR